MKIENMNFERINFNELSGYEIEEAVESESEDLILTVVEQVINERFIKLEIIRIIKALDVPRGLTFREAENKANHLIEKIYSKAIELRRIEL